MLLVEIARTSQEVAAASARRAKIELLGRCLRDADPAEVAIAVAYLSGELPQRQIGVGYAALRDLLARAHSSNPDLAPPSATCELTVAAVDAAFTEIGAVSGKGSAAARRTLLADLFGRASKLEQDFLVRLLAGELRQGALDGVLTDAVAAAAQLPAAEVRRAAMLRGALGPVATAALTPGPGGGLAALRAFGLEIGRPVRPMLAQSAASIEEALTRLGIEPGGTDPAGPSAVGVEWKLDGIRIQAHLAQQPGPGGGRVRLFTRTLDDITQRLPEVAQALAALPVRTAVFDGELIALRPGGRPHPFQVTYARTATQAGKPVRGAPAQTSAAEPALSVFLFDVLHLDGEDLLDRTSAERHAALAGAVPTELRMPRLVTGSAQEAADFFADALAHGHEGVVMKSLDTPYTAGRRGAGWVKVKPRHTLDLVVLAAEWGYGRRTGWLSNLHLGARDPRTGGFVMLGKTFKGLTDELLGWQTEQLTRLAVPNEQGQPAGESWVVHVRPELVVEIAFDGVQRSSKYPGGLALRFARVLRYRPDKPAAQADTIDMVRAIAARYLD